MKTWKKVLAIGLIGALALGGMAGCTRTPYSQEDIDKAISDAKGPLNEEINALTGQVNDLAIDKQTYQNDINQLNEQIGALENQAQIDASLILDLQGKVTEYQQTETKEEFAYIVDDIEFGDVVSKRLDDSDINFFDGKIEFDSEDYDVQEFLDLNLILAVNGLGYDKEFYGNPYFIGDVGALEYTYNFDDAIALADITEEEPLFINFLGETLNIVKSDSNEIEIRKGTERLFYEGDILDGITLVMVGENDEVQVAYNGYSKTIDEGETKKVGDLDVYVKEVLSNPRGGIATLVYGDDVTETYKDGDEWIEDDERFIFGIDSAGGDLLALKVTWDVNFDEPDDDYLPIGLGDSIALPNNYVTVLFDSLEDVNYEECRIYLDDIDAKDDLATDENAVFVKCDEPIIEIDGEEVEKMFIIDNGDFYYFNEDRDVIRDIVNSAKIVNDDIELDISLGWAGRLRFEDKFSDVIKFDTDIANLRLGATEEGAEASDVQYIGNDFGKLDGDLLTGIGVIVKNVESYADKDEGLLVIPDAQVLANLAVSMVE